MYHITEDNLYLIPMAFEVPVTNFFRNVIINKEDLPIKCTVLILHVSEESFWILWKKMLED